MQTRSETQDIDHPLKNLTPAQFMALGGNAVVYIRPISGKLLANFMADAGIAEDEIVQMVVSADGSPLLVADTTEAVADWLLDKDYGVVALH